MKHLNSGSQSAPRQAERKARQFCRQVCQALNLALEDLASEQLSGVFAEEVCPAPDCGRLLVYISISTARPVAEVLQALRRETPKLRSEVAASISRKRTPELLFVPVCQEGGSDE